MSAGVDAVSVPAARAQEYDEGMVRFYVTKDGSEMMAFLWSCHRVNAGGVGSEAA
jgi:hypothetical protein